MSAARTVQASRRALRIDAPHVEAREEASFPFVCPECGEGSGVATSCPRCDVEMRDAARTVQLPRRSDARDGTIRNGAMAALALGVAIGVPLLLILGTSSMNAVQVPHGAWMVAGVLCLLAALVPAVHHDLAPRLARRRAARALREDAGARATRARRSRVEGAKERVLLQLRGRVRVEDGRLVVEDGRARVHVPVCESVRVIAEEGERHALSEGEEVEVVGVGAYRRGAGDGYRDTRGELELDGAQPIDVWVR